MNTSTLRILKALIVATLVFCSMEMVLMMSWSRQSNYPSDFNKDIYLFFVVFNSSIALLLVGMQITALRSRLSRWVKVPSPLDAINKSSRSRERHQSHDRLKVGLFGLVCVYLIGLGWLIVGTETKTSVELRYVYSTFQKADIELNIQAAEEGIESPFDKYLVKDIEGLKTRLTSADESLAKFEAQSNALQHRFPWKLFPNVLATKSISLITSVARYTSVLDTISLANQGSKAALDRFGATSNQQLKDLSERYRVEQEMAKNANYHQQEINVYLYASWVLGVLAIAVTGAIFLLLPIFRREYVVAVA